MRVMVLGLLLVLMGCASRNAPWIDVRVNEPVAAPVVEPRVVAPERRLMFCRRVNREMLVC